MRDPAGPLELWKRPRPRIVGNSWRPDSRWLTVARSWDSARCTCCLTPNREQSRNDNLSQLFVQPLFAHCSKMRYYWVILNATWINCSCTQTRSEIRWKWEAVRRYLFWKCQVRPQWWWAADTRPHLHPTVNPGPPTPLPGSRRYPSFQKHVSTCGSMLNCAPGLGKVSASKPHIYVILKG